MKLHLPKVLRVAVLTAVAGMGAAYATDMYTQPTFTKSDGTTGPEYTWDNDHWVNSEGQQANPARTATEGPLLIVNDAGTATNSVSIPDTSDYGGIKVTGNSNFTTSLGSWAGSIYVGKGSALSASYNVDLKSAEGTSAATVYVDGRLTITGRSSLSMADGNNYQNWYIGKDGFINLSQISSVNKGGRNWNMQLNLSGTADVDITSYTNRTMGEGGSITKEFMSTGADLYSQVNSWTVFREGEELDASAYTINHTASGMSVTYTGKSIQKMSLTWAGGEDTWEEKGTHWTDSQGTVTSFASGDDVTFNGTGNKANVSGGVMADTVTVDADASLTVDTSAEGASLVANTLNVGDGASFNLAAGSAASVDNVTGAGRLDVGSGSSLTISGTQTSFSRLVTGENGALHLNMSSNVASDGNSTIVLADGSTIKDVYVDSGCFAANTNNSAPVSNLRGANLHLKGSTYVVRNGVGSGEFAPSEKVYLSGDNTLQVYGSVGAGSVLTSDFIQEEGKSASLRRTDGGTITMTGTITLDKFFSGGGTTVLGAGNKTTIGQLRLSEQGQGNLRVAKGAVLNITGSTNNHSTADSIVLSHWGQNSTLEISGGTMNADKATVLVSWTGTGTFKVTDGTATVKGVNFFAQNWGGGGDYRGSLVLAQTEDGAARLNIGSDGISYAQDRVSINLGAGTVGATADWRSGSNGTEGNTTPINITLSGTTGNGTVFDTTDAVDNTTGRTITLENGLTGAGILTVTGNGKLVLSGASDRSGATNVNSGTLQVANDTALGSGAVVQTGGTLEIAAEVSLGNRLNQTAGAISVTEGSSLTLGAGTISSAITNAGTVTLEGTIAGAIGIDEGSGGSVVYIGLNGEAVSATGNYFSGTTGGTVTVVNGGTSSGTVSYNSVSYTLEEGKITLNDSVDYGTFYVNEGSVNVSDITASEHVPTTVQVSNGTLVMNQASEIAVDVKGTGTISGENVDVSKVGIAAQSTATMTNGITTDGVTFTAADGVQVKNTNSAGGETITYGINQEAAQVKADVMTVTGSEEAYVTNSLVVKEIVNNNSDGLKLVGNVAGLVTLNAAAGDVSLLNQDGNSLTLTTLNIAAGKTVELIDFETGVEGVTTVTSTVTAGAGSKLFSDLKIGNGVTLDVAADGVGLTLGSQLTMGTGVSLSQGLEDALALVQNGGMLTLVTNGSNSGLTYGEEYNGKAASTYFNTTGWNNNDFEYSIVANDDVYGIVKNAKSPVIPEPTTGTLSLLALAGLMARRRRRK